MHDVLARALTKWRRVAASDDPTAYVNQMLVNAAISWLRKPARREQPADHQSLDVATTGDHATTSAERDAVMAALRALPARHRAVLVLRYYEGLPDAEIAQILGMAAPTVRSSAFRAMAALRKAGLREGAPPAAEPPPQAVRLPPTAHRTDPLATATTP